LTGKHLHLAIDFRSYDSESILIDVNSGVGVPGVAGAETGAGDSGAIVDLVSVAITSESTNKNTRKQTFFWTFFFWNRD
jgi:hypothetical protein